MERDDRQLPATAVELNGNFQLGHAVRDALLSHELLRIYPGRTRRGKKNSKPQAKLATRPNSAGIFTLAGATSSPVRGAALDRPTHFAEAVPLRFEEALCSTNKIQASGQN